MATFVGRANLYSGRILGPDTVGTPIGRLQVPAHTLDAGTTIQLLIRPERVVPLQSVPLQDASNPAPNTFEVQLKRDVFHGAVRHLEVLLDRPAADTACGAAPSGDNATIPGTAGLPLKIETATREPFSRIFIPPQAVQFLPAEQNSRTTST